MNNITNSLNHLTKTDIYSLLLFCLFKIKDIPEYSTLSELAYILDKDNLLKLCEYFELLTITIPTIDDIESLVESLLLYQYVNIEKMDFSKALKKITQNSSQKVKHIKENYYKLTELLNIYEFKHRENL